MPTLSTWLTHIETLHPEVMDFDRTRFQAMLKKRDLKPHSFVITVAGTNGKGTTVALLENLFSRFGLTTGVYTSPHLLRFNERIRLNQKNVDDDTLIAAFEHIEKAREKTPLTFFEFTTLAAFHIFAQQKPDVLILEIGLGGRLDAVNTWDPNLAVITSIDLDHCAILGDTREAIAKEKAGIFRPHTDAVIGELLPPDTLFEAAKALQVPLSCIQKDFHYDVDDLHFHYRYQDFQITSEIPHIPSQNAATAITAFQIALSRIGKSAPQAFIKSCIQKSLHETKLLGRFTECDYKNRKVILDVAHNPHAAKYLRTRLAQLPAPKTIIAVMGMLKDKDMRAVIAMLSPVIADWYFCALPGERGTSLADLKKRIPFEGKHYDNPTAAFHAAHQISHPSDTILVLGSFITVAEILTLGVYSSK